MSTIINAAEDFDTLLGDDVLLDDLGLDDVKPKPKEDTDADTKDEAEEEGEEEGEEAEEEEGEEAEEAEEAEESEEEGEESEEEEGDESEEISQDELTELLGLEEDGLQIGKDGELRLKTNINGEIAYKSISDIVKGFQTDGALSQKGHKQSEEYKTRMAEVTAAEDMVRAAWGEAQSVVGSNMEAIQREYNNIDWTQLRDRDTAEFAAQQLDFQTRYQAAQQQQANVQSALSKSAAEAERLSISEHNEYVRQQSALALDLVPEWTDASIAKKEQALMIEFLSEQGFSGEESSNIYDARMYRIINDARKYKELKSGISATKNKVRSAPKRQAKGKGSSVAVKKGKAKQSDLMKRQRDSGNLKDTADAFDVFFD